MSVLDNYFGLNAQSVLVRAKRAETLASNLINADTPNYKAKDIDFKSVLATSNNQYKNKPVSVNKTHHSHLSVNNNNSFQAQTKFRIPEHASLDGNTVDAHVEKGQFAENAVRYQISLSMLNNKIQGLISTLKGE